MPSSDPSFRALEAIKTSNGWVQFMVGSTQKIRYYDSSIVEVQLIDNLGEEEFGLDDLSFLEVSAAEVASALHLSLPDFGRVLAYFIREWPSCLEDEDEEAVYISERDGEDFVCMIQNDCCHMLYGDGSIRVAGSNVVRSLGVEISPY